MSKKINVKKKTVENFFKNVKTSDFVKKCFRKNELGENYNISLLEHSTFDELKNQHLKYHHDFIMCQIISFLCKFYMWQHIFHSQTTKYYFFVPHTFFKSIIWRANIFKIESWNLFDRWSKFHFDKFQIRWRTFPCWLVLKKPSLAAS